MSEYTQRYQHVSHHELYESVNAGDPKQIDGVGSQWSSLKDTLDGLARDLSGDLDKLANTWTGSAGQEFQRRLSLIVEFSGKLSEGMTDVRQGLSLMSDHLRTAQQKAESPAETDDNDKALSAAGKGLLVGGLPGAVVGGLLGHQQDKAEQEKAHQRMVQVVADLAAGYDVSAYGRVVDAPAPGDGLPDHVGPGTSTPHSGPGASTPTAAPTASGLSPHSGGRTAPAPGAPSHGPTTGPGVDGPHSGGTGNTVGVVGSVGTAPGTGTSLAGADPLLGGALLAGGLAGIAGLAGTGAPTTGPGGSGPGMLFGASGGTPAGGVLGTGSLASGRGAATPATRPTAGTAPAENRSAAGTGRLASGRAGTGGVSGRSGAVGGAANRSAMTGATSRSGVVGGHRRHDEDESDERLTWLTEDEMVWQDGDGGAPPVLGAS